MPQSHLAWPSLTHSMGKKQSGRTPQGGGNEGGTDLHSFHAVFIPWATKVFQALPNVKSPSRRQGVATGPSGALGITKITKRGLPPHPRVGPPMPSLGVNTEPPRCLWLSMYRYINPLCPSFFPTSLGSAPVCSRPSLSAQLVQTATPQLGKPRYKGEEGLVSLHDTLAAAPLGPHFLYSKP